MSNELQFNSEQIKLLEANNIIPKNCPSQQVEFFSEVCKRKKLDPFLKQIHLIERRTKSHSGQWIQAFTIQAGIDGMRAIAQRNGTIVGTKRGTFIRDGKLYGCCTIKTRDGGEYYDEVLFDEYVQKKQDGSHNVFWARMPETMIKKVAEESCLRMAAPEDLSGVYGDDEMLQAESNGEVKLLADFKQPESNSELLDEVLIIVSEYCNSEELYDNAHSIVQKYGENLNEGEIYILKEAINKKVKALRVNNDEKKPAKVSAKK